MFYIFDIECMQDGVAVSYPCRVEADSFNLAKTQAEDIAYNQADKGTFELRPVPVNGLHGMDPEAAMQSLIKADVQIGRLAAAMTYTRPDRGLVRDLMRWCAEKDKAQATLDRIYGQA